ncbi:MAG: response regulator transcription factor [Campylobacter sp.]|nr:response regulator transcription factor [Campylobacter sp.]
MQDTLKSLTILIVEDEKSTRDLMINSLEGVFSKVLVAQNGDEGLKKFKKYNPNIVLTDIVMPIVDGLTMAKEIKEISSKTIVIVLSAFSERQKLLTSIDIGIDKYVLKPIDMEELLNTIKELVTSKIQGLDEVHIGDGFYFSQLQKTLKKDGVEIPLTKKELAFISLLAEKIGVIVSMDEIKENIWYGEKTSDAAIRTFIKRVRDKVGYETIKNISGLGYKIDKTDN